MTSVIHHLINNVFSVPLVNVTRDINHCQVLKYECFYKKCYSIVVKFTELKIYIDIGDSCLINNVHLSIVHQFSNMVLGLC